MTNLPQVPDTIPRSKVAEFLNDLGFVGDVFRDLRELSIGVDGVHAVLLARDEHDKVYVPTPGSQDLAEHHVAVRLDWDA